MDPLKSMIFEIGTNGASVPWHYNARSVGFMSTLQQRIDEYLCDKTPVDDVEVPEADSSEVLREREDIDMQVTQQESP
jgi:hypothetical protein